MANTYRMNANLLERYLQKPSEQFTKADIIKYCDENEVEAVNFHYCGWDGKLKTLNFIISSREHLETILGAGERVDGSSLFPFIKAGRSDLYVVPKFRSAFRNPFAKIPTVDLLCSFFDRDGRPFESSPEYILHKAHLALTEATGLKMQAMAELEFYIIAEDDGRYPVREHNGYHQSSPFGKFEQYRTEAMKLIAQSGGKIKYGHCEVGNFTLEGKIYEQDEIEFLPVNIEDAADQIVVAKWIMRCLANQYGLDITFAPKITVGKAGSGMHIHCKFTRDGKPAMLDANGSLSEECRKAIAGFMIAGESLPAFGNPNPLSFMRLVPRQEAPTSLCWSFSNRSALVRVPLGWNTGANMLQTCNPLEVSPAGDFSSKQTFEWRASDASADTYLLMAALCVAARCGLEREDSLEIADKTFVDLGVDIHDEKNKVLAQSLKQLPDSCASAADELENQRNIYTAKGVFSEGIVDWYIQRLRSFNDAALRESLDSRSTMRLVKDNLNIG